MIYEVYFSTLNPHLKVWDNYPLLPIIIFFFPTAMQVKVDLSGEYFIFINEMYLVIVVVTAWMVMVAVMILPLTVLANVMVVPLQIVLINVPLQVMLAG